MRKMKIKIMTGRFLHIAAAGCAALLVTTAQAAAPGITGGTSAPIFDLRAEAARISQPDGATVYSWGYGCNSAPTGFAPAAISGANCPTMQIPGPTLIVHQGDVVTVKLTNNLPAAAGNTSILFPGFAVTATGGSPGILAPEAANGSTVTYTFTASTPGTHAYYSGTQGDLQIEMGLYGALIVLPSTIPTNCTGTSNDQAKTDNGESDYRLAAAAYNHAKSCYDREYLFQFSEMDPRIHSQAEQQANLACAQPNGCMSVETEPYHPAYFMMNGRSFPDNVDPNYASQYPHQPYNANPHMHPGELTLVRQIGTGRWQHPFHEHANHLRVLARDGNLLLTNTSNLAGPLLFTTTSTPGLAMDSLFYWTGKGLNWDVYGHGYAGDTSVCIPDANGYYTSNPAAPNYFEWCGDHDKALEHKPFGQVGSGGPVTLPDPNILANGPWYGGSPYLGPEATQRAVGATPIPPSGTVANSPTDEAGFAFMWHSHNERELTTNNIFPGGLMTLMLVDPRAYKIDEAN
ncbi:MAG: multicopper oxidase family protein [Deltaproteobacteria bacterium]|jgi:FtsP/CotA-like multicopper oxidase with cupredoxin domain|nr:multicopper oxidase family protein [Deltaproteobacteria bacterium]